MMKNLLMIGAALLCLFAGNAVMAKKVKFMVNMQGYPVNVTGMHITGDFQTVAGFAGGDWNSASTSLVQEPSDTNLYSIVVDIPAFNKYEYKFVNGDQFYEVEFVPIESRVGYNFNDSRWIYIDSLANDTTVIGPLRFSGNAPMGKYLMRFLVDMHEEASVDPAGVHIAGDFQSWNPAANRMYSFVTGIWEHIAYVDSTVAYAEFKYVNGSAWGSDESVPGACATGFNRYLSVPKDSVLPTVCYGSCSACLTSGTASAWEPRLEVFPNPASASGLIRLPNHFGDWTVNVMDQQGRLQRQFAGTGEQAIRLEREGLAAGLYFVTVRDADGRSSTQKLVFR
ncbi:MAG: T9SS type A sorting domain-containing protein [Bacteroidia bacterium]